MPKTSQTHPRLAMTLVCMALAGTGTTGLAQSAPEEDEQKPLTKETIARIPEPLRSKIIEIEAKLPEIDAVLDYHGALILLAQTDPDAARAARLPYSECTDIFEADICHKLRIFYLPEREVKND